MIDVEKLEGMLGQGRDSALLRFGLGKAYLDLGDGPRAAEHLSRCVELDADYSAAWKMLGKAQMSRGDRQAARSAWERGILAAQRHGDAQAEKEMTVFLRRLLREG